MADQCVFCSIVAGTAPSAEVAEGEATYAFMDLHPASEGHLLVVPKRHSTDLLDIPAEDLAAVTASAQQIAQVVVEEFGADGVNLLNCCGARAWQTVFHFHLHVIPRYADPTRDGLVRPWAPGVEQDPQVLAAQGRRLRRAAAAR